MAKPIFIIELHEMCTFDQVTEIQKDLSFKMQDYHILTLHNANNTEVKFSTFYEKDFTEINYKELRELIEAKLKK